MKVFKLIQHTIVALLQVNALCAQDFVDIAKVHYAASSINNFEGSTSGSRLDEVGVDLLVPFVRNERLSILSGLTFEGIKTQLYPDDARESFGSIMLKAGFSHKHSDKWWGTYIFLPKIATDDFKDLTGKDFQFGGIALMRYNHSENLKYRFGVYGNSELFGPWIVPIVGFYYLSPTKKFEANFTLPLAADMNYKIRPRFHVGTNFFGLVRTYHLSELSGSTGSTSTGYVARSTNEVFAYVRFNLGETSIIQLKMGATLGRSYRVYYEYDRVGLGLPLKYFDDDRVQLNKDFEDGLLGQVTYIYRVGTGK